MDHLNRLTKLTLNCLAAGLLLSPTVASAHVVHAPVRHVHRPGSAVGAFVTGLGLGYAFGHHNNFGNHHHHPPTRYPNDRRCSWGSGYQGCWHRKEEIPVELDIERPERPEGFVEETLDRGYTFCNSFYGCGAGADLVRW